MAELKAKLRAADDSEAAQLEEQLHTKTRELESHNANGERNRREILYGTESGVVGLLTFVPDAQAGPGGTVLQHGWSIPNVRRLGGINCMGTCDITKDGRTDMLVGRDDGTLEIWSMDMGVEPSLIFSKCINESISGVECGLVTAAASEDVLLSTFSGKIIAFSAATAPGPESAAAAGGKKFYNNHKGQIKKGINVANKVAGGVDTFAGMGGAALCGPYAGACKVGAMGAHAATSVANAAAKRYIKTGKKKMMMQMLLAQQAAEQRAAMGMIY